MSRVRHLAASLESAMAQLEHPYPPQRTGEGGVSTGEEGGRGGDPPLAAPSPRTLPSRGSSRSALPLDMAALRARLPSCAPVVFDRSCGRHQPRSPCSSVLAASPSPSRVATTKGGDLGALVQLQSPDATSGATVGRLGAPLSPLRSLRAHALAHHEALEALLLGAVRQRAGALLLPPLIAKLKALVAAQAAAEAGGSTAAASEKGWKDGLSLYRLLEELLGGGAKTGFFRRG